MDIPTFTTPRLILRPLELSDAPAIQEVFPQWQIVRFLTVEIPWPYPSDGGLAFVRDMALPAMREGREWHWSIRPKASPDRLIGVISLMDKADDNRGFWLDPERQRQGLMTEASAVANIPSRRISERTGMRVAATQERDYVSGRFPAEIWEITADEWRRQGG